MIRVAGGLPVVNGYVDQRYQEQMLYSFENYGPMVILMMELPFFTRRMKERSENR